MHIKRLVFWIVFFSILAMIVFGLNAAMNKQNHTGSLGAPAPVSSADHVEGPANAPVTIIEYSDFQCPACEMYYPVVEKLMTDNPTLVRLVYRHFPLPQHANARLAAAASEAAASQGRFWEMYRLLFSKHAEWTEVTDPHAIFGGYAKSIGLDMAAFKAALDASSTAQVVESDLQEGEKLGIDSTPTFFVNGAAITNPQSYEAFKALVEKAAASGTR